MSDTRIRQALTYAARGWPVFPCQAGQKIPATAHGHLDATTESQQITALPSAWRPGRKHRSSPRAWSASSAPGPSATR